MWSVLRCVIWEQVETDLLVIENGDMCWHVGNTKSIGKWPNSTFNWVQPDVNPCDETHCSRVSLSRELRITLDFGWQFEHLGKRPIALRQWLAFLENYGSLKKTRWADVIKLELTFLIVSSFNGKATLTFNVLLAIFAPKIFEGPRISNVTWVIECSSGGITSLILGAFWICSTSFYNSFIILLTCWYKK